MSVKRPSSSCQRSAFVIGLGLLAALAARADPTTATLSVTATKDSGASGYLPAATAYTGQTIQFSIQYQIDNLQPGQQAFIEIDNCSPSSSNFISLFSGGTTATTPACLNLYGANGTRIHSDPISASAGNSQGATGIFRFSSASNYGLVTDGTHWSVPIRVVLAGAAGVFTTLTETTVDILLTAVAQPSVVIDQVIAAANTAAPDGTMGYGVHWRVNPDNVYQGGQVYMEGTTVAKQFDPVGRVGGPTGASTGLGQLLSLTKTATDYPSPNSALFHVDSNYQLSRDPGNPSQDPGLNVDPSVNLSVDRLLTSGNSGAQYDVSYWFPFSASYAEITVTMQWTDPSGQLITKTATKGIHFGGPYNAIVGIQNLCSNGQVWRPQTAHLPGITDWSGCSFPQNLLGRTLAQFTFARDEDGTATQAVDPVLIYQLPPEIKIVRQPIFNSDSGAPDNWTFAYSSDAACGPDTTSWTIGYPSDLSLVRCERYSHTGQTSWTAYNLYNYFTTRPAATLADGASEFVQHGAYFSGSAVHQVYSLFPASEPPVSSGASTTSWGGVHLKSTVWNRDNPDLVISRQDAQLAVGATELMYFQPFYDSQYGSFSYTDARIHIDLPPAMDILDTPVLATGTSGSPLLPPVTADGTPVVPICTTTQRTATTVASLDCELPGTIPAVRPGADVFACGPADAASLLNCFDPYSLTARVNGLQIFNAVSFSVHVRLDSGVQQQSIVATGSIWSRPGNGAYADGSIPPNSQLNPYLASTNWTVNGAQNLVLSATPSASSARSVDPIDLTLTYKNSGSVSTAGTWVMLDLGLDARGGSLPSDCTAMRPVLQNIVHAPTAIAPLIQYTKDSTPSQGGAWVAWSSSVSSSERALITGVRWQPNSIYTSVAGVYGPFDDQGVETVTLQIPNDPGKYLCNAPAILANGFAPAGPLVRTLIVDNNAPRFSSCPAETDLECITPSGYPAASFVIPVNATASNGAAATVTDPGAPATFGVGTTPITYVATDAAGLTDQCVSTVKVQDTTRPSITCAPTQSIQCDKSGAAYLPPAPTASDACSSSVAVTASSTTPVPVTAVSVVPAIFTYTATDAHSLTSSCSTQVQVVDTQPPVFSNCVTTPLTNVACSAIGGVTGTSQVTLVAGNPTATDACSATSVIRSTNTLPVGTTTVTWTASDSKLPVANTATCSRSITVVDDQPPVFNNCVTTQRDVECTSTALVTLGSLFGTAPTGFDTCVGAIIPTTSVNPSTNVTVNSPVTEVWTAKNTANNMSSTCTRIFQLTDTTPPVLTNCPGTPAQPSECSKTASNLIVPSPSASDACSFPGSLPILASVSTNGGTFTNPATGGAQISLKAPGVFDVKFSTQDNHGLKSTTVCQPRYTVRDTTIPVLTCPATAPFTTGGVTNVQATAIDSCDTTVTTATCAQITLAAGQSGQVSCQAQDASGNIGRCTVQVAGPPAVAISETLTTPAFVSAGAPITDSIAFSNSSPSATQHTFIYDLFGYTADGQPLPGGAYNGPVTLTSAVLGAGTPGDLQMLTGTSLPSGAPSTWNWVSYVAGTSNILGVRARLQSTTGGSAIASGEFSQRDGARILTLTFAAPNTNGAPFSNSAGYRSDSNAADASAPAVLVDRPPVALCANASVSSAANACGASASINAGSSDPDPGDVVTVQQTPVGPYLIGTTHVVLTATDSLGNSSTCSADVTVADVTKPLVNCPAAIAANCASPAGTAVSISGVTASDLCTPGIAAHGDAPALFAVGSTTVTFSASDTQNTGTCATVVTVSDLPPVLSCPALAVVIADPETCSAPHYQVDVRDACDGTSGKASCEWVLHQDGSSSYHCAAIDSRNHPASCDIPIQLQDTTAPAVFCSTVKKSIPADEQCRAFVDPFTVVAHDACDSQLTTATCTSALELTFAGGSATCTASDGSNSSSCDQPLLLVDQMPPVLTCAPVLAPLDADCHALVTATAHFQDNCDSAKEIVCGSSGTLNPGASATVACNARDSSNNEAIGCSVVVTAAAAPTPTLSLGTPSGTAEGAAGAFCNAAGVRATYAFDPGCGSETPVWTASYLDGAGHAQSLPISTTASGPGVGALTLDTTGLTVDTTATISASVRGQSATAPLALHVQTCATCTDVLYLPGQGEQGWVLFEDLWPKRGDLDFNDLTVTYNYAMTLNAQHEVTAMQATYNVMAVGATLHNALKLHFPGLPRDTAFSIVRKDLSGATTTLHADLQEDDLVIPVADDLLALFTSSGSGFINTDPALPERAAATFTVLIQFGAPVTTEALHTEEAPFDLFLAHTGDPTHQIHLPHFAGTKQMNRALFGSGDDRSDTGKNAGLHYITEGGLPFALVVPPGARLWPQERVSIDKLYPHITPWAASGGTTDPTWYAAPVQPQYGYTAGLGGRPPPSPVFVGDADGTTELTSMACQPAPPMQRARASR